MVSPYRDFCGVGHFSWAISRKTRTELGFELHDTRRSDPRRVGRSDGMRHLLGNCVRLVAAPARTSCSRKELSLSRSMSCLRRPQSEKNTYDCFDRLLRHSFRPCSAATCRRGATTHAMAAKVILSLMVSLSVLVDARVPRPSCVPEQQTRTYSVVIRHSPQSTTHLSLYNASEVS